MADTLVCFNLGEKISEENYLTNRTNVPIPVIGSTVAFSDEKNRCFLVERVGYNYQIEGYSTHVWVFLKES